MVNLNELNEVLIEYEQVIRERKKYDDWSRHLIELEGLKEFEFAVYATFCKVLGVSGDTAKAYWIIAELALTSSSEQPKQIFFKTLKLLGVEIA